MSTAALQSVPHQSTTNATNSSVTTLPPGRPCTSGMTQARESYFASSTLPNASSSAWRSSRRPSSGSGTPVNSHSQSQARSILNTPSPSSSRVHHLSLSAAGPPAEHLVMSPGDSQRGVPPVISPRTSSNRASHNNPSVVDRNSSRKSGPGDIHSPSHQKTNIENFHSPRDRHTGTNTTPHSRRGNDDRVTYSTSRRTQSTTTDMSPDPTTHNRERNATPGTSSSASRRKVGKPTESSHRNSLDTHAPTSPLREASEVLNRIVISQPEVDIERERERMAEAVPATQGTPDSAPGDTSNKSRTTRSRHDYSTTSSQREKSTKFGEYFLGGTLGEGEFGKVKMGWKQEDGVQVSF